MTKAVSLNKMTPYKNSPIYSVIYINVMMPSQKQSTSKIELSVIIPVGPTSDNNKWDYWIKEADLSEIEIVFAIDARNKRAEHEINRRIVNFKKTKVFFAHHSHDDPGSARNVALALATGNFVIFVDCDDIPEISNVLNLVTSKRSEQFDIILGQFRIWKDGELSYKQSENRIIFFIVPSQPCSNLLVQSSTACKSHEHQYPCLSE